MTSTLTSGQERFKQHLRKVGSGEHTSQGMSRAEAADALELMLQSEASPAQIGAFLIAHRIRRPEPQELTGMLDTYRQLGQAADDPQIAEAQRREFFRQLHRWLRSGHTVWAVCGTEGELQRFDERLLQRVTQVINE